MRELFSALVLSFVLFAASAVAGVTAGQTAPAIELPQLDRAVSASLFEQRGKVVYLDFWASWCGPCRLSFPQLEALYQELGSRGFEVIAVNVDKSETDARRFLDAVPVSYAILLDPKGTTPAQYGLLGMPTGYLIDREGVVQLVHQGYRKSDGEHLRTAIIELLER